MNIDRMLDVLEDLLCQAIVWSKAIQAISETWNQNAAVRHNRFLVGTVYDALWDALITKTYAIWDDDKGVISLRELARHFKTKGSAQVANFAATIERHSTDRNVHLNTIKLWRNNVVAHRARHLRDPKNGSVMDDAQFEQDYGIHVSAITDELQRIEGLLGEARGLRGEKPAFFGILKEDAARDANLAMDQWSKGADAVRRDALASVVDLLHSGDDSN